MNQPINKSTLWAFGTGVAGTLALIAFVKILCPVICPCAASQSLTASSPASLPLFQSYGAPPSRGSQSAAFVITEFADFHCGYCKKAAPELKKLVELQPGKVRHIFRHFPLSSSPGQGSFLTHEASECAYEQGKFWEYHDGIFAMSGAPDEPALYNLAAQTGLEPKQFSSCLKGGKTRQKISDDAAEGSRRQVQGTPTYFIGSEKTSGFQTYEEWVAKLEGKAAPAPAQPPAPAVPPPAKIVNFNSEDLKGRPSKGPEKAPVTLVEFSDFHCPFCAKVAPTLEKILQNYSGKVRRVWRHYPLPMHPGADRTHEASECAHEQGKFWEYHDKLFSAVGGFSGDPALIHAAQDLKLNEKKFKQCLESGKVKKLVQDEILKGQAAGVTGTPAVFVNGELVSGAVPYEHFEKLVKSKLEQK